MLRTVLGRKSLAGVVSGRQILLNDPGQGGSLDYQKMRTNTRADERKGGQGALGREGRDRGLSKGGMWNQMTSGRSQGGGKKYQQRNAGCEEPVPTGFASLAPKEPKFCSLVSGTNALF